MYPTNTERCSSLSEKSNRWCYLAIALLLQFLNASFWRAKWKYLHFQKLVPSSIFPAKLAIWPYLLRSAYNTLVIKLSIRGKMEPSSQRRFELGTSWSIVRHTISWATTQNILSSNAVLEFYLLLKRTSTQFLHILHFLPVSTWLWNMRYQMTNNMAQYLATLTKGAWWRGQFNKAKESEHCGRKAICPAFLNEIFWETLSHFVTMDC